MTSLDTHAYDAKWRDRLNHANAADEALFADKNIQVASDIFSICLQRTNWPDGVRKQAQRWHTQLCNGEDHSNMDRANEVSALDILMRLERIIQYRLSLEDSIAAASVADIDNVCAVYSLVKSGDCLDFDGPDDNKHPIVVDHSDLQEQVRFANTSLIDSYIEQLADVQNGACPQGRTTRLFQIYVSFY